MNTIFRIIIVIVYLLFFFSCRSSRETGRSHMDWKQKAASVSASHTWTADTSHTIVKTFSEDYVCTIETETITEYDTSQPSNPVAKKTEKKKKSVKGTQTKTDADTTTAATTDGTTVDHRRNDTVLIQDSETDSSTKPVAETGVKWYVTGAIALALVSLVASFITRRLKRKAGTE